MQPRPLNVMFGIPTFSQSMSMEFVGAAIRTQHLLTMAGIASKFRFRPGLCFVDVARNFLASEFLDDDTECTDLFFIDDDVGWTPEKVMEFLVRPEDVIAGVYPKRQDGGEFPCILKMDDERQMIRRNGLYQALTIPGGFLRIRRHVLEKLAANAKRYKYPDQGKGVRSLYNIFEVGPDEGGYCGEDTSFCKKWTALGGEIWVDPSVEFTHRGSKKWEGTFSHAIKAYELHQLEAQPKSKPEAARELLAANG